MGHGGKQRCVASGAEGLGPDCNKFAALRRNLEDKPAYVLLLFNAPKFTNVDIQWFVGAPLE